MVDLMRVLPMSVAELLDDWFETDALKGALAQQAGRHEMAKELYTALTAFEPANGTWQAGLAMALDRLGNPEDARQAYRRAMNAGGMEPALLAHVERRLAFLNNE
jgi:Flp pilus assembly protein TadD